MAGLERRLGVPLFVRTARGTTLTKAGDELLRYARRTVALLDEASLAVRTVQGTERLALAAPAGLVSTVVPGVLEAVAGLRIDLRCWDAHSVDVVAQLLDGSAHVGFITHRAVPTTLRTRSIVRSPVVAVAAPQHRLLVESTASTTPARHAPLSVEQVAAAGPVAVHGFAPQAVGIVAELRAAPGAHEVLHLSPGQAPVELATYNGFVAVGPVCMFATALRAGLVRPVRVRIPAARMEVRMVFRAADADLAVIRALCAAVPALRRALQPAGAPTSAAGRAVTA